MTAAWVAGTVRAHALLTRRVGPGEARRLAASESLAAVVRDLAAGPYGREIAGCANPVEAEAAVGAAVLWHLRVLAGWLPGTGVRAVRAMAAWFEAANAVDHARRLAGTVDVTVPPYRLGALATAWPRLSRTTSLSGLRAELAASTWGDPGAEHPAAIATAMSVAGCARVAESVPEAAELAAGAAALQVARDRFLVGGELPRPVLRRAAALLGSRAVAAADLATFATGLRPTARWVLLDTDGPEPLIRAEREWWRRLELESSRMLAGTGFGPAAAIGCVLALAADARRVRAAITLAARGGAPLEAFDALF